MKKERLIRADNGKAISLDSVEYVKECGRLRGFKNPLYLVRLKTDTKVFDDASLTHVVYYVADKTGKLVAKLDAFDKPDDLSKLWFDYKVLDDKLMGKGIATLLLGVVMQAVFIEKDFTRLVSDETALKAEIKTIELEIAENNLPSQRVAEKCGFKKSASGVYEIDEQSYLEKLNTNGN